MKITFMSLIIMVAFILGVYYFILRQNPKPVPKDKEPYIGIWISNSGFKLEIKSSGIANLTQIVNSLDSDFNKLNIKVAPTIIKGMITEFKGDSVLKVIDPYNYAKEYKIQKQPYLESDTLKMILNGVTMTKN